MKLCQNVHSNEIVVNFEAMKHSTRGNADSSVSQFLQIMTLHCPHHFYAHLNILASQATQMSDLGPL